MTSSQTVYACIMSRKERGLSLCFCMAFLSFGTPGVTRSHFWQSMAIPLSPLIYVVITIPTSLDRDMTCRICCVTLWDSSRVWDRSKQSLLDTIGEVHWHGSLQ